jgi:transcriptional regulator with XRE-family HTH domain
MSSVLSAAARAALRQFGQDLREARLRRRIPSALLAERSGISRSTLYKIERGAPGVAVGHYVMVLHSLGLAEQLRSVFGASNDELGLSLVSEQLPKRIRKSSILPKSRA